MLARRKLRAPFDLDTELVRLSSKDSWTLRDAVEGVQIFGAIGSGKTSGSGALLAHSFLEHGFGGIVCCAKPEERVLWEKYASATGRRNDLVIIAPGSQWCFNILDYERQRRGAGAGQTENLINLLATVIEIAEGSHGQATGDRFWERAMKELLRNAVDLLSIAGEQLSLETITHLITDAPQTLDQVQDDTWQKESFCWKLVTQAHARPDKTAREAHDLDTAARYWFATYPRLSERTRSSIVATFTSVADILLHGLAWELFCTTTTIVPEVTYKNGAIVVLDFPVQEFGELGRIVQGIFKLMFQRAILRRSASEDPRPVFLWADEAQNFISSFDYQYQSVARSARAATVYLTQNISNYFSVLKSRDETHALLGNFQTKIFHANGDFPTNQYAADVIAQKEIISVGFNTGSSQDDFRDGERRSIGSSGSEHMRYKVMPAEFTTLRKGGAGNHYEVDSIIFQGGRVWHATRDTYLQATFKQR